MGTAERRILHFVLWLLCGALCLASFLVLATNHAVQHFALNADQLTVPGLAEELLRNPRFDVTSWSFPAAPLIADTILYLPLRVAFGAVLPAILASGALHFALLALGAILLLRRAFDDPRRQVAGALFLAILLLGFALGAGHDWRQFSWPFMPFAHAGAMVAAIYAFLCYERARERNATVWELAGAALSFVALLSDSLFVAYFVAPYFVLSLASANGRPALLRSLRFAGFQIAAWVVARWLLGFTLASDIEQHSPHLFVRIAALVAAYWKGGPLIVVCTIAAVALTYGAIGFYALRRKRLGPEAIGRPFDRAIAFLALAAAANVLAVATIWSGENLVNGKYAPAFQIFPAIIAALLVGRLLSEPRLRQADWGFSGAALTGIVVAGLAMPPAELQRLAGIRLAPDEAVRCLDREGLGAGLAGYWDARPLTLASGWRHQVDQLYPGGTVPLIHGSNGKAYQREMETGLPIRYDFVVTNGIEEDRVTRAFGEPGRRTSCGPYRLFVYADPAALTARVQAIRPVVFGCAACNVNPRPTDE